LPRSFIWAKARIVEERASSRRAGPARRKLRGRFYSSFPPGRVKAFKPLPLVLVVVAASLAALAPDDPAAAVVTVQRAESNGQLRLEGNAAANRDITVDGIVMRRSGNDGRFRIERSPYAPPGDCTVDVNDGSTTEAVATLAGCVVSPATTTTTIVGPTTTTTTVARSTTTTVTPPTERFRIITTSPLPNANVGTEYTAFIEACCGNGTPYR
jgi:hypothetical protein